ncbi:MAG TPA: hypothetical protein VMH84_00140 [Xanthobacteraceae bacterium]|nr:hypothetical protein [Xanthobacteraceae bacterium]
MNIATAFSILSALLSIVRWLIEYMHKKEWIEEGYKNAVLEGVRNADAAIEQARQAREQVRAASARGADPMSDDEFRRND